MELNDELVASGHPALISTKRPHEIVGRQVNPGSFGLYEYGSGPKLLLKPGRYPGAPFSNWIGCHWKGTFDLATNFPPIQSTGDTVRTDDGLLKLGLTIVQVAQNQAAVCIDPQMRVFVVSDGGFVAMATSGAYRVLGLVDQTHLTQQFTDKHSKAVLAKYQVVKMPNSGYVAAQFLDIPANNVVILQRKDELFQLPAGQHYLTTAAVTVRECYTLGEVQQELQVDSLYTRDQVPVWLRLYLRYQLRDPLKLAQHGYPTPFDALQDKTRSILTQITAHLDYSTMARTRNAAPDIALGDASDDINDVFVSAVRAQAIDELKVVAAEYGIRLEDLAIIDRKFKGEIAQKLDSLTTRALEAQVESANLDRENANKRRKQEGEAKVLELQNAMARATVETEAANTVERAKARAMAVKIEAEVQAAAIKIRAEAEAEATRLQMEADAAIIDGFARGLAERRMEVKRVEAFGPNTVFAPMEALNAGGTAGMGLMLGAAKANGKQ